MTYRLYWNTSTGAFAVDAALTLAGAPVERIRVDHRRGENRDAGFLAISPLAQIPTLVLPDGTAMTESAAQLLLVAERFPAAALAPSPDAADRPRFLRWLLLLATSFYEAELRVTYPQRYTAEASGAEAVRHAARATQDRLFALVETALGEGPFLLGTRFTALDPYLAMLAHWYEGEVGRAALDAHRTRVRAVEGIEATWRRYFPEQS